MLIGALIFLYSIAVSGSPALADVRSRAHSDIQVILDPDRNRISATVKISLWTADSNRIRFHLSENAEDLSVTVDDRKADFSFRGTTLLVDGGKKQNRQPINIRIRYTCRFNDSVPYMPINTDNPGYGVTATISEKGTLLLAGSGWYPDPQVDQVSYRLQVDAPEGILAVTAGRLEEHSSAEGRSRSIWKVDNPVRGLALSAARFQVNTRKVGSVTAATYFLKGSEHLSESYLEAVERYLVLYQDLFGPYPFSKFAVVENFFPTGYGFPSYTLLGGRVLRLPFIKYTSLGHEIAHCWWGNGVYVDYSRGNWSEGLTTYVADYLYKEQKSAAGALDYRRQMLRNYAALVSADNEFPISRFISRTDRITKTIGYDKAAMVFHMIRQKIGDKNFWETLRDVFEENLFETISWEDWRRAFESRSGKSLKTFFDQWVIGTGAPKPAFESLNVVQAEEKYLVTGSIVQTPPYFSFTADLVLETRQGSITKKITVSDRKTDFQITSDARPERLTFDPESNLWRRLYDIEVPPTVNSIKGSNNVAMVVASDLDSVEAETANTLAAALGLNRVRIFAEDAVDLNSMDAYDLVFFGRPKRSDLLALLPENMKGHGRQITLNNKTYHDATDVYFGVVPSSLDEGRVIAFFWPNDMRQAETVVRKIPHYGRYSYLVFRGGRNINKGTWPITESPLNVRLELPAGESSRS